MSIESVLDCIACWFNLVALPFLHFDLLWRMLPVYLNGLLASIYFGPSNTAATFGGLTALWAGADWIRGYLVGGLDPTRTNWMIAIIFCVYGVLALVVGLTRGTKLYGFFGRRSIQTFFGISFCPVQAGLVQFSAAIVVSILLTAIPVIAFFRGIFPICPEVYFKTRFRTLRQGSLI